MVESLRKFTTAAPGLFQQQTTVALDDVSFTSMKAKPCRHGTNGSGKSTLAGSSAAPSGPTSGRLVFAGEELEAGNYRQRAQVIRG